MRRGLRPEDLGDLFDLPLTVIVSMAKDDGTVFSRPVWHRWPDVVTCWDDAHEEAISPPLG